MARASGKQHFIRSVIARHPEITDQTAKHVLPVLNEMAKKENMGFEITTQDFANYRNELKKKSAKEEPATMEAAVEAGRTETHKTATHAPAAKRAVPAAVAASDPLAAAKAVKALVSQFGAETVKGLADLFSK